MQKLKCGHKACYCGNCRLKKIVMFKKSMLFFISSVKKEGLHE